MNQNYWVRLVTEVYRHLREASIFMIYFVGFSFLFILSSKIQKSYISPVFYQFLYVLILLIALISTFVVFIDVFIRKHIRVDDGKLKALLRSKFKKYENTKVLSNLFVGDEEVTKRHMANKKIQEIKLKRGER